MNAAVAPRAEIRRCISRLFDDAALTAFVSDYFPEVNSRFSIGMSVDQKQTMLLDSLERHKLEGYARLLDAARNELRLDEQDQRTFRADLEKLVGLTEHYLSAVRSSQPAGASTLAILTLET